LDKQQILNALRQADAAGNTEDAQQLAEMYNRANSINNDSVMNITPDTDASFLDNLAYGIFESSTIPEDAGDYLESIMPLGRIGLNGYISPEESYGEGFMEADSQTRREMIQAAKTKHLQETFPEVVAQRQSGSKGGGAYLGNFVGVLADPTFGIGLGMPIKAVKGMTALSAGFGFTSSATHDLARTGTVDPTKAAVATGIGAGAGFVVSKAASLYSNKMSTRASSKQLKGANSLIEQMNLVATREVANGKSVPEIGKTIEDMFGVSPEQMARIQAKSDIEFKIPTDRTRAQETVQVLEESIKQAKNAEVKVGGLGSDLTLPILSRIANQSKRVAMKLTALEANRHGTLYKLFSTKKDKVIYNDKGEKDYEGLGDFLKLTRKLSKKDKQLVTRLSSRSGNRKAIKNILSKYTDDVDELDKVYRVVASVGRQLKEEAGLSFRQFSDYMPRVIKDSKGLTTYLNRKYDNVVDDAMAARKAELEATQKSATDKVKNTDELLEEERELILDALTGGSVSQLSPATVSFVQKRMIPEITEDLLPYYKDFDEAIADYLTRSTDIIELAKFIGKENLVMTNKAGKSFDIEKSLDNYIPKTDIPFDAQDSVRSLLVSRFGKGMESPHEVVKFIRDGGYLFTLANFYSALTQLSDIGLSAVVNGFIPTIKAFVKRDFDMKEFGLDNYISAMATNPRDLSRIINGAFTASGFSKVDRIGKNIYLNAAWSRLQKEASSPKGLRKLSRTYKEAFGDEYEMLAADLKAGNITENVRLAMFAELMEVQPIALSKMPKAALDMPNGRIFYMLKHYGLNQLNFLYKNTFKKMASSNREVRGEGLKSLMSAMVILPAAGASIDSLKKWIKSGGEDFDIDDFPLRAGDYLLRMFGLSAYTLEKFSKNQNLGEVAIDWLAPPVSHYTAIIQGAVEAADGNYGLDNPLVQELPIAGDVLPFLLGSPASDFIAKETKATNINVPVDKNEFLRLFDDYK